jgi:hypothetical protein
MTPDEIILLQTFDDALAASLAQDKLKENGIDSFLEDENVLGLNPLGGVGLKIFLKDKERAEIILAE